MKEIKIQKLSMSNFKGCQGFKMDLGGKNASIYGDNATGKTTVYDALTWLLFGKDSRGSSDQETIKPLDADGNVMDHNAVTTVEAVLIVDSTTTVTLRKEMKEAWTTRRGSVTQVYDGNIFTYYWNDVPIKKMEFTKRAGELVDEDVFRMLTSVTAFAFDLPWRKRREILYELSGVQTMSDRALLQEAAKAEPEHADGYEHVADQIGGGMTLDELKRVLLSRRRGLLQTRDQTPARIDELNKQKTALEVIDFEAARLQLQEAQAKGRKAKAELEAGTSKYSPSIEAKIEAYRKRKDALDQRAFDERGKSLAAIKEVEAQKQSLIADNNAAKAAHIDATRKIDQKLRELERDNEAYRKEQAQKLPDLRSLQCDVDVAQAEFERHNADAEYHEKEAAGGDRLVDDDRAEWLKVNQESFAGGTCPTCGQELPMQMMQDARTRFEQDKNRRLAQIQAKANDHKAWADKNRAKAMQDRLEADAAASDLEKAQKALDEGKAVPTEIRDMDGYREKKDALVDALKALEFTDGSLPDFGTKFAEFDNKIKALQIIEEKDYSEAYKADLKAYRDDMVLLEAEMASEDAFRDSRILTIKTDVFNAEAAEEAARGILAKKEMLATLSGRIDELTEGQRRASAELEEIDLDIFAMESFIRWKTHFIEDSINGLFKIVTFRLFREQANGGLEERCDVVVNGVPYAALNNGARINAGMDIIRRLAEHYGVRVPLFVDNAESVTRLEDAGTQVIRLVVSEQDKVLRVETV